MLGDYWIKASSNNKPFDYYPKGRVEINNGKAIIYLNPNIATNEILGFIKNQFHLNSYNGIKNVRLFPDGSSY